MANSIIGQPVVRKDAVAKAAGAAQYVDDIRQPEALFGVILRSPHHHARLGHVDTSAAEGAPGVVAVLTADDVPGSKTFGPLLQDRPALAFDVVRHTGEPVALVVAESRAAAERALDLIEVDYTPLPAVHDPVEALDDDAPPVHTDGNLITEYDVSDGDAETALSEADVVVEGTFDVPRISPAYMEPEASMGEWHDDGTLTVWVSSQKPFEDRHAIASVLGLDEAQVRVRSAVIGGAFGGKEDSGLAVLAGLAAWLTQSTVRIVNRRHESFVGHPKRHPARLHVRLGAKRDGALTALDATVHLDTGAYASYGPAVAGLLTEVVPGAYRIPNVRVHTLVAYTNNPFSGAMRGFGSPQAHFATESLLDMLAAELGIDPLDLRQQNSLRPGDRVFTRVVVDDTALSLPRIAGHVAAARERLGAKPTPAGRVSGVGFAYGAQTMGLGHGVPDDSTHRLEWLPDGHVRLYLGAPDLGQGLAPVAEQIAADTLGLPYEAVGALAVDTALSPNGGVTCASRMTYMVGNAVTIAAEGLIDALLNDAAWRLDVPREKLSYEAGHVELPNGERIPAAEFASRAADEGAIIAGEGTYSFPYPEETTPDHLPIGMPHVMFCFGAQVVRVEVDPDLGTVDVTDLVAIHDVGRVINRAGVEGQIEGGAIMGIGYALYEDVALKDDGRWVDGFAEYLLPTTEDVPPAIESVILEVPEPTGPHGAKGIAELTLVPTGPAIANAVYDATGVRVTRLPIQPEVLAGRSGD